MTYDIYAIFHGISFHVCSAEDSQKGMDVAAQVCENIGASPMAFAAIIPGVHNISVPVAPLQDLIARSVP